MQIQVLEQATALISAHAIEAEEECEAELCSVSEDEGDEARDDSWKSNRMDPEQRQLAFEFESRLLRQHLLSLTQNFNSQASTPPDKEDRHLKNLASFFQTSLKRASACIQKVGHPSAKPYPRRMTVGDDTAPRLSSRKGSVLWGGLSRSRSLDERRSAASTAGRSLASSDGLSLDNPTEQLASTPHVVASEQSSRQPNDKKPPVSQYKRHIRGRRSLDDHNINRDNLTGTATIYRASQRRSKAEIIADLSPHNIEFPAYARELIADLDCIHNGIPLELPSPFRQHHIFTPLFPDDIGSPPSTVEDHKMVFDGDPPKRLLGRPLSAVSEIPSKKRHDCIYQSLAHSFSFSRSTLATEKPESSRKIRRKCSFFKKARVTRSDTDENHATVRRKSFIFGWRHC
jgi:hypothetical protein